MCIHAYAPLARTLECRLEIYTLFSSLFEEDFNVFVCRFNDYLNAEKIRLDYL